MDVSDLRKRILRALDDARKDASLRRQASDEAAAAYTVFLEEVAVPLFRQAATVLRAEGQEMTADSPAGSVRLSADRSRYDFVELELDTSGAQPQVIGRTSVTRGRGQVVEERPIAPGKAVADLTEEDVSAFLISEVPRLVVRR